MRHVVPLLIGKNTSNMQALGCKLSPDDIYSVNHSSLKDAVVQFGGGCTAEIISPDGLIITNHHCGFSSIQSHSSVQNDFLTNGFWAMSRTKSCQTPDCPSASWFVWRMLPIGAERCFSETPEAERSMIVSTHKDYWSCLWPPTRILAPLSHLLWKWLLPAVYEVFNDVRLVGAPPEP